MLTEACHSNPTYLDRYYALQPGRPNGAKRLILLLPAHLRRGLDGDWIEALAGYATIVWRGPAAATAAAAELNAHEYAWVS
jgi:hypothetical protein